MATDSKSAASLPTKKEMAEAAIAVYHHSVPVAIAGGGEGKGEAPTTRELAYLLPIGLQPRPMPTDTTFSVVSYGELVNLFHGAKLTADDVVNSLEHLLATARDPILQTAISTTYRMWRTGIISTADEERYKSALPLMEPGTLQLLRIGLHTQIAKPDRRILSDLLDDCIMYCASELLWSRLARTGRETIGVHPMYTSALSEPAAELLSTMAMYCILFPCFAKDFRTMALMALVATALDVTDLTLPTQSVMAFYMAMGEAYSFNGWFLARDDAKELAVAVRSAAEEGNSPIVAPSIVLDWMVHGSPVALINSRLVMIKGIVAPLKKPIPGVWAGVGTPGSQKNWWADGLMCCMDQPANNSTTFRAFPTGVGAMDYRPVIQGDDGKTVMIRAPLGFRYYQVDTPVIEGVLYDLLTNNSHRSGSLAVTDMFTMEWEMMKSPRPFVIVQMPSLVTPPTTSSGRRDKSGHSYTKTNDTAASDSHPLAATERNIRSLRPPPLNTIPTDIQAIQRLSLRDVYVKKKKAKGS